MMEQAEAAWDEAGRLGVVARNAIERGFTVNLPGFAARLRMVDEIEQARMTQAQLRRSNNLEAWEEADRAKQKATTELLKALAAIAVATSQAERELRETANLPALAGALRDSANEDLECARDIGEELAQLGREAFSLLAVSDATVEASADEKPIPVPITGQSETPPVQSVPATHAAPERQEAVVVGGVMEAQDTQGTRAVPETREEQPSVSRADIGTGGNRTPGVIEAAPGGNRGL